VTAEHRHGFLLVDDDADTREALLILLEGEGYEGFGAANGREALDLLRRGFRPCMILLDLAMPEMDGLGFRRAQLSDPELAAIPVVVVSAGASSKEAEARRLGMATFLRKPMDLEAFIDAVEQHFRRAG
jgi:two-component system, chemotaxis family, chemotaxis protein CheY